VKVVGIDPGTRSFDIVLIEGEEVVDEKSLGTEEVARNPRVLIDALQNLYFDRVAAPSGYGVPPTFIEDVIDPHRFAVEVLLLSTDEDIDEGVRKGDVGAYVYRALALIVEELWRSNIPAMFIPSAILLPTIPTWRKINRIDMGTADKLAVAALAVYDQSTRLGIDYEETSFVLVEMGFGYNAVLAIEGGKVIDGLGGTASSIGFLTSGPLDAEVVVVSRRWSRVDVFHGGVVDMCSVDSLEKAFEKALSGDETCLTAVNSYVEGIVKSVASILQSFSSKPKEIVVSGRYARSDIVYESVAEKLKKFGIPVRRVGMLRGAKRSKEAAQGYAIIGEGLLGGVFHRLVKHMEIDRACGTVLSWVVHPRARDAKQRVLSAYLESVSKPKLCEEELRL